MTWPQDGYDTFTDPVSDTPLSGPHRSTTVAAAIHSALRALQRKVGFDLDTDTDTLDNQMRTHQHLHDLMEHVDTSGAVPLPGQVVTWQDTTEDGGTQQWQPSDPPVNDHGGLPGLGDDDHPHYSLAPHGHVAEGILDNRFFRSHSFANAAGVSDRTCFIAPFDGFVRGVHAFRVGGTSASVNARINGTTSVLASALVTVTDDAASNVTPDVAFVAGDYIEAQITAIVGTSTIFVQIDLERVS